MDMLSVLIKIQTLKETKYTKLHRTALSEFMSTFPHYNHKMLTLYHYSELSVASILDCFKVK